MKCQVCQSSSRVIETRETLSSLRRRRECLQGHKFSTLEVFAKIGRGFISPGVIVLPAIHGNSKIGHAQKSFRNTKAIKEHGDGGGV